ncbi:MAG: NAD(P)/FAD-dependent oxidoreductase [Clostridia bacterium]|nr:NAD(P)/FAD-dependent oxidoreductase [Clostridia bacterium]
MSIPKFAVLQKPRGEERTYGVTPRIPGGFITPEALINIANVAKKYGGTIKITSGQRIAILGVKGEDVDNIWEELDMEPGVLSPYSVKNIELCPASFCKRAKQNSLKLGMKIEHRFYGAPAPNRTKIAVVGCRNGCASANAKDIAVLADEEGFIIRVGGSAGFHPRLPDTIAEGLNEEEAFDMVEAVFEHYCEAAAMGDKLGPFIDQISFESFKVGVMSRYQEKRQHEKTNKEI